MAVVETKYVKWSVRMNLGRLIRGEKIVDWWPDTDGGEMWEVEPRIVEKVEPRIRLVTSLT